MATLTPEQEQVLALRKQSLVGTIDQSHPFYWLTTGGGQENRFYRTGGRSRTVIRKENGIWRGATPEEIRTSADSITNVDVSAAQEEGEDVIKSLNKWETLSRIQTPDITSIGGIPPQNVNQPGITSPEGNRMGGGITPTVPVSQPEPVTQPQPATTLAAKTSAQLTTAQLQMTTSELMGGAAGQAAYTARIAALRGAQPTQQPVAGVTQQPEQEKTAIDEKANKDMQEDLDVLFSEAGDKVDLSASTKLTEKLIKLLEDKDAGEKPKSFAEQFAMQRAQLGVGPLEDKLAGIDAEIAKLDAGFTSTLEGEEGRQVSMAQIRRRQGALDIEYN